MSVGVKETKEMLLAVNALTLFMIEQFKDGVQFSDFLKIYSKLVADDDFKQKMTDAYVGVKKIPTELKDIDVSEIIEITSMQLQLIPELIKLLKK